MSNICNWNINSTKYDDSTKLFNEESVIKYEKRNKVHKEEEVIPFLFVNEEVKKEKKIFELSYVTEFCESIKDKEVLDKNDLFELSYVLKEMSNYMKEDIKNRGNIITDRVSYTEEEYIDLIDNFKKIKSLCNLASSYFLSSGKNQTYQNLHVKLFFKTSSYKMCNQKHMCMIHRQNMERKCDKNHLKRKCDKNHFVHKNIINDIDYLIKTLEILGLDNLNWIMNDKYISILCEKKCESDDEGDSKNSDSEKTKKLFFEYYKFTVKKIKENIVTEENPEETSSGGDDSTMIIDKKPLLKSVSVISFILKYMYDESFHFLGESSSDKSLLINNND
jgi:hypothetical protein